MKRQHEGWKFPMKYYEPNHPPPPQLWNWIMETSRGGFQSNCGCCSTLHCSYSELVKTKAVKDKLTLTLAKDVKIVFVAERVSLIVWELVIFFSGAHQWVEVVWPREWTPGNDCCGWLTFQPPALLRYKDIFLTVKSVTKLRSPTTLSSQDLLTLTIRLFRGLLFPPLYFLPRAVRDL